MQTQIRLQSDQGLHCLPFQFGSDMTKPTMWHRPSMVGVFAVHMKKPWVLSHPLSAQQRLWSDWADAQADLSLCWAHAHFVGFVISGLKCNFWMNYWMVKLHCSNNPFFCQSEFFNWAMSWENLFMPYANNKGADQPVHPHSLISTFIVCCLDSRIPLLD